MKLTGEERVRFLLGAIPYFRERQYSGNYYDNDDLNDILEAIERSNLTVRQRQVIELTFIQDMTQKHAGMMLGIGQRSVAEHEEKAIRKITEAYEKGNKDEHC